MQAQDAAAAEMKDGLSPTDTTWLWGFHLNSPVFRIAAAYESALKFMFEVDEPNVSCYALQVAALKSSALANTDIQNLDLARREVNQFKHGRGTLHRRWMIATKGQALSALRQLLALIKKAYEPASDAMEGS